MSCREAVNECDIPESCTGDSSQVSREWGHTVGPAVGAWGVTRPLCPPPVPPQPPQAGRLLLRERSGESGPARWDVAVGLGDVPVGPGASRGVWAHPMGTHHVPVGSSTSHRAWAHPVGLWHVLRGSSMSPGLQTCAVGFGHMPWGSGTSHRVGHIRWAPAVWCWGTSAIAAVPQPHARGGLGARSSCRSRGPWGGGAVRHPCAVPAGAVSLCHTPPPPCTAHIPSASPPSLCPLRWAAHTHGCPVPLPRARATGVVAPGPSTSTGVGSESSCHLGGLARVRPSPSPALRPLSLLPRDDATAGAAKPETGSATRCGAAVSAGPGSGGQGGGQAGDKPVTPVLSQAQPSASATRSSTWRGPSGATAGARGWAGCSATSSE